MKIPSIITKHKLKASLVVAVLIAGSVYAAQNNGSDKAPEFKEAAAIKGDVGVFFEADGRSRESCRQFCAVRSA